MALQKQKIPLQLTTGIDTKNDEFNSVSFKNVENFRFNKPGALNKVPGYTAYTTNLKNLNSNQPTITDGSGIYSFRNELLLNTSKQLLSYSDVTSNWASKNYLNVNSTSYTSPVNNSSITYVNTTEYEALPYLDSATVSDFYTDGNYSIVVASDAALAGIKINIYETAQNLKIVDSFIPDLSVSPATKLSVRTTRIAGIYNNKLYVVCYLNAGTDTLIYAYNLAAPNDTPTTTSKNFDDFYVCTLNTTTGILFLAGANGTTLKLASLNVSNGTYVSNDIVLAASVVPTALDLLSTNSTLRVTGYDGATVYSLVVSQSALTTSVSLLNWATADNFSTANDGNNTYLIYSINASTSAGSPYGSGTSIKAMNAAGTTNVLGGTYIVTGASKVVGKALYDSGLIYFNMMEGQVSTRSAFTPVSVTNATLYTLKINVSLFNSLNVNAEIIAQSGYFNTTDARPNHKIFKSGTSLYMLNTVLAEFYTNDYAGFVEIQKNKTIIAKHTLLTQKTKETVTDNYLVIPSSVPKIYDGRYVYEAGFATSPNFINAVAFTGIGAGSAFPTGVYGLAAVYKWTDNNGAVQYSVPQFISFTVGIANLLFVELEVRNLCLTNKENVYIEIYSTAADGSTYYRVPIDTLNDKYKAKTTISLYALQAGITSNETLYTTGGILENDLAAPAIAATSFKDRIFLANSKNVQYSNKIVPGEAIEFYRDLYVSPNLNNSNIVGIEEMDNVLAIFGSESISVLSGEGPNALGEQNDYQVPQQISSDVGCTEAASIVKTPEGIMFKSEKGIYMLNRGLYVSYIGAPVEAYNSETIIGARLLNNTNEVRFLTATKILSYDYLLKQWSVFTNISGTPVDCIIHDNNFHYVGSTGIVYAQDDSLFTKAGSFYAGKLETNWITVSGLNNSGGIAFGQQGFQRLYSIYLLGQYKSAHNLSVSIAYNYDDTIIDMATVVAAAGTYQYEVRPSIQKCESFKLIIEDTSQAGTGESLVLSNILLEIGIKGTPQKVTGSSSRFAAS